MKKTEVMLAVNGKPVAVYDDLESMIEGMSEEWKKDFSAKLSLEFHYDDSEGNYCELVAEQKVTNFSEMGVI